MNQLDQLFRTKLDNYRVAPPAESWAKVEAKLSKKNNYAFVWRIAAGLFLFGLALGAGLYWQTDKQEFATTPVKKEIIEPETELPLAKAESNEVTHEDKKTPITKKKSKAEPVITPIQVADNKPLVVEEIMINEPVITISEPVVAKVEKPIVIEFTLEPLPTTTTVAEQKNPSTFRKVWDKAIDIKNGEGDFGSLREAKDELFALDFRKDKTKRN